MNSALCSVDWIKVAHVLQALLTPAIGIATVVIAVIATKIQRQQAATNRLHYRLALFERRMKVFDATLEFIGLVLREARIDTMEPLFNLIRGTREHRMLFGSEIGEYIDELYAKGGRLHVIDMAGGPERIIRAEDIPEETAINLWFNGQTAIAQEKFLKYIDFREP
jgi:hypothetical protein